MPNSKQRRYRSLKAATTNGSALECLQTLAYKQAIAIDEQTRAGKLKVTMVSEYRATIMEISRLEDASGADDPVARMVEAHRAPGTDLPSLSVV